MNKANKLGLSIVVVLAFFILLPEAAAAQCACSKPNITALDEYKNATVVFTGEIIDIQRSDSDTQNRYYETVKIAVDHVWKLNIDSIVTVKNYVYGCVQDWKVGDKYLVYGYQNKDNVTYSTGCCCSRTGPLERTEKDISEFFNAGYARSNVIVPRKEKIISAGWMNRRAINFSQPKYPSGIKKPKPSASVEVMILTDVDGNVTSADIIRGRAEFHDAALIAASSLKFPPTLLSGVPTKVSGWVSFDFKP